MERKEYAIRDAWKWCKQDQSGNYTDCFEVIDDAIDELFELRRKVKLLEALSIMNQNTMEKED